MRAGVKVPEGKICNLIEEFERRSFRWDRRDDREGTWKEERREIYTFLRDWALKEEGGGSQIEEQ